MCALLRFCKGHFLLPHCASEAEDPSSNTSRQDKAFLYGKKHIAKSAACLLVAGRAAGADAAGGAEAVWPANLWIAVFSLAHQRVRANFFIGARSVSFGSSFIHQWHPNLLIPFSFHQLRVAGPKQQLPREGCAEGRSVDEKQQRTEEQ